MSSPLTLQSETRCFDGWQRTYSHNSTSCKCEMRFAVYLPPAAEKGPVPAVYWLSGLTCTEENFSVKAGAQRYASELGLALVIPDTSPRGLSLPGEDDSYDFGTGAGFYVTATEAPWAGHYDMQSYVRSELPSLVEAELPILSNRRSISGHSMGGHGALTIGLKNPDRYRSISAFSPISSPMQCPWGEKALTGYLGENRESWREYDASWLARNRPSHEHTLLVDQGEADNFLQEQLKPEELEKACRESGQPLELRMRPGYDHSYFFIATYIGEHLEFHHRALRD